MAAIRLRTQTKPLQLGPLRVDPPLLQAPMAGFTNFAFRRIVRSFGGVGLLATEMISAEGFVHMRGGLKGAPERLWGVQDEPRPLAVQMWNNDENVLAEVGKRLVDEYRVSVVDLNFGCPVRRICNAQSGSYLLGDPGKVGRIVGRVVQACAPTPVTAKIRLGRERAARTGIAVARSVRDAGAAGLTVHGRVAADFFKGRADWDAIGEIKAAVNGLPIIGNGDLDGVEKIIAAFERYRVDGVMIARAALTQPWLFRDAAAALRGEPVPAPPSLNEQKSMLLRHKTWVVEHFGEDRGIMLMRKFACNYANGRAGARTFRGRIHRARSDAEFVAIVEASFPCEAPETDKPLWTPPTKAAR